MILKKNKQAKYKKEKPQVFAKKKNKKKNKRKKNERGNTTENTYILLGVTIRLLVDVDGLNTQYPNKILKIRCISQHWAQKTQGEDEQNIMFIY